MLENGDGPAPTRQIGLLQGLVWRGATPGVYGQRLFTKPYVKYSVQRCTGRFDEDEFFTLFLHAFLFRSFGDVTQGDKVLT